MFNGGFVKFSLLTFTRIAVMEDKETSCHSCPLSALCSARSSGTENDQEATGCKLVSQAIAFFLLPIASAIVVAALVNDENTRILVGFSTLIFVSAVVAAVSWFLRRKRRAK